MIDKYDIKKLEYFVYLAKAYGTDVIKITAGDEPSTWVIKVSEEFLLSKEA